MNAETAEELRRAWAETERVRAVLRDVEWSAVENVDWDGVTAACCPSCGGIKPGEYKNDSKAPFGHLDTCALVAALLPTAQRTDSPDGGQMSPIEHELVCPQCLGPIVLDGPLRCGPRQPDPGDAPAPWRGCGWSNISAAPTVRSGRTRPNQETPFR